MPDGSCIANRIGAPNTRFSIVLTVAAILGLSLTYSLAVQPTAIAARAPSSVAPTSSSAPVPSAALELGTAPAATDLVTPDRQVPAARPSTAAATPAASAALASPATAASDLVPLVPLTIDVWNADERYFSVSGSTPDEIVASARANVPADPSGAARSTMAYVGPITWEHRPAYVQDPATGSCTMTAVASTVTYQATLPQWTSPASVSGDLVAWWQAVLEHVRAHESEHVRIFEIYVDALSDRVAGQPCEAWDAIIGQWTADLTAAQSAFDVAESHWSLPAFAGMPGS
jgi:predicted secreted Zn-dependent protease